MAIQNQTMHVYESLKSKIDTRYYSPAENLREVALAEEYGVSRNTIKKALLMLENDGYVSIEQNKGAKVRSFSKEEVVEFLELRELLEGFVARLTATVISDEVLQQLKDILSEMAIRESAADLLGYSALNREFHNIIYTSCPNKMTVDILVKLKNQMKKYNSKSVLIPGRCELSFKEHTAIYNALYQRDANAAQSLMEAHIHNVRTIYIEYFDILF